jgi:hypothetical protein
MVDREDVRFVSIACGKCKIKELKRKGGARGKYVRCVNHVKILGMTVVQRRSSKC